MPYDQLNDYAYRGARALVLLHDSALRGFLPVWQTAARRRIALPQTEDPDYASLQSLLFHVLRASRGYMTWLCEKLELPDPGIDDPPALERVEQGAAAWVEHALARWRLPLRDVPEKRFGETYVSRWGETISCEAMLEHAVMHPLRHRFQLEELMERG